MNDRAILVSRVGTFIGQLSNRPSRLQQLKKLFYPLAAGLMLCLAPDASAQDWHWTGTAGGGLWGTPGNWLEGTVPPTNALGVWLGAFTITVAPGTVENPGTGNLAPTTYGSIFGPEFGGRLNIYGELNYHWVIAAVQGNPDPAVRTSLNMYDNSILRGVNLGVGSTWWFQAGPFASFNMYSNAQAFVENLWWGGHVNVYGNSVLTITNAVIDQGNLVLLSDATRWINLGGGKLVLPAGIGTTVTNWITRGILLAHGNRYDTNAIIITDQVTNTIVTTGPLGGALQRIYFQPTPSLMAGSYQQALLVGDYPNISGVVVGTAEPGVDPATLPGTVTYQSSNPNVVTVSASGILHALRPGVSTLTATLGSFSSTNALTIVVTPLGGVLAHRYSFSESGGTTTADSVGGPSWDGALSVGTLAGGQLTLDGISDFVMLPSGVVGGMDAITIETWATFPTPVNSWSTLYAFGAQNGNLQGMNYISLYPHTGPAATEANFGIGDPGTANLQFATTANVPQDGRVNTHLVAVYYPMSGSISLYTNGTLANTSVIMPTTALAYQGLYNVSPLNYLMSTAPISYIGNTLWAGDPLLNATLDEFRIYNGALSPAQIQADGALGPNQLIGSNTSVTLSVVKSGGNLVFTWPNTSALVNLTSSSTLTPGSAWDPVNQPLSIVSGNYQVTVPIGTGAQFFRLEK